MYVDLNTVTYDEKKDEVILTGTDLDKIILNDWTEEFTEEQAEVTMKFNLNWKGHRIYMYKILKSQFKDQSKYKTMKDMVLALNGKVVNLSSNFLLKDED